MAGLRHVWSVFPPLPAGIGQSPLTEHHNQKFQAHSLSADILQFIGRLSHNVVLPLVSVYSNATVTLLECVYTPIMWL